MASICGNLARSMALQITILSGGQSGVDRAALDAAIEKGLDYRGWCPKGGSAEDLPEPPGLLARYPHLRETPQADPAERKPCLVLDLCAGEALEQARAFLAAGEGDIAICIAGPRESEAPGIYAKTRAFLRQVLREAARDSC
jgi:hypothetical protein